jgi:hypothetical protein
MFIADFLVHVDLWSDSKLYPLGIRTGILPLHVRAKGTAVGVSSNWVSLLCPLFRYQI